MTDRRHYLTPNEVAALLHVSPVTVRHWAAQGKLSFVTTPGGHRRFPRAEVERLARKLGADDGALRILVVDDDLQLAGFLAEWLATLPQSPRVETACDGFEAGQKVAEFRPHVVLLDLMMPALDGFQTCRRIKKGKDGASIRVITMTGYHTAENHERALAAGADACLAKPLDMDRLRQELAAAADFPHGRRANRSGTD